ncbi:hypothetical protein BaRGS_00040551 [Batillaria attramentaria]|uniref:Uncharacterized protein n=1 Tax=Batillaria attramentaria TaxID=370345 RepID=A0ABD0J095_9CAEN
MTKRVKRPPISCGAQGADIKHPSRGHVMAKEDDYKMAYVTLELSRYHGNKTAAEGTFPLHTLSYNEAGERLYGSEMAMFSTVRCWGLRPPPVSCTLLGDGVTFDFPELFKESKSQTEKQTTELKKQERQVAVEQQKNWDKLSVPPWFR